ncbi:putative AIM2 family protein C30D10.14 [Tolypocladium ophioglossoides CBS 100239]|uniref:Putative AIM2 family protein C30D10.14 n=1 Tax=Tolypocladium ophioglossoides (strain CBS 100239) TaxID=1163406 RepID=A0A0L0N725_TOLOC|nr:putative AIM2 family protein C30D10.14 [Tolypocladium ophioglossoides CBS 100239]
MTGAFPQGTSSSTSKALRSALRGSSRRTTRPSPTAPQRAASSIHNHPQLPHLRHSSATRPPSMSTMPASHGHSAACCNIPPIVSKGYKPKGSYEEFGGYKTYVTGPADATKAIVLIFDIFGYFDQTVQGADILAYGDDTQKYRVFIPDWFKGKPCPIEWYPPDTEEKHKKLGHFFSTFPPAKIAGYVPGYVKALEEKNPSLSKFGIMGMCWGGKVVALSTKAATNPFSVAAAVHPAMVDAADADGIKIPFALLASKDESPADVKKFEDALTVPKHVETFADQIHGWMGARGDLSDSRVREEYGRGYETVLGFFAKYF